jgi:hypothetical protein
MKRMCPRDAVRESDGCVTDQTKGFTGPLEFNVDVDTGYTESCVKCTKCSFSRSVQRRCSSSEDRT